MRCSIRWYIEKAFNCCRQTTVCRQEERTVGRSKKVVRKFPYGNFLLLGYKNRRYPCAASGRAAQIHAPGFYESRCDSIKCAIARYAENFSRYTVRKNKRESFKRNSLFATTKDLFPAVGNVCVDIVRCDDLEPESITDSTDLPSSASKAASTAFVAHFIALAGQYLQSARRGRALPPQPDCRQSRR